MNIKNKQSDGQWMRRLFKHTDSGNAIPQNKTYFGHCYSMHGTQGKLPFGNLFADKSEDQFGLVRNETEFQQVFEQELALLSTNKEVAEPSLNESSATAEDSQNLIHPPSEHNYRVLNCYCETLDTKTFQLCRQDGQHLDYLPGQYVTVSLEIAGQEHKRSYSLTSTPTRPGCLEITVKRDPNGGVVSNWLNDNLKEGDSLLLKGPFGKFTCARETPRKILFLAAGSGIVPIMSMLRWLSDTNASVDVVLLLSFRTQYDIIFCDELKLIATHHHHISLLITLTKEPSEFSNWPGLFGRVTQKMISACVPDISERVVYLCGPDAFMAESKHYLQNLGLPAGQLHCESFSVKAPQAPEQAKTQQYSIGRPSRTQTGNYRIRFAKSGKTISADGTMPLLELAEKSGIAIGYECRAGDCGECMVKCLKGNIEMTGQSEIDDIDRKKGWVYACCAYPVSNVVLDI